MLQYCFLASLDKELENFNDAVEKYGQEIQSYKRKHVKVINEEEEEFERSPKKETKLHQLIDKMKEYTKEGILECKLCNFALSKKSQRM